LFHNHLYNIIFITADNLTMTTRNITGSDYYGEQLPYWTVSFIY